MTRVPAHDDAPRPSGPQGPPGPPAAPRRRAVRTRLAPVAVLGGVAAATALVATVDPHRPGHYPTCPFLFLTGLYCPGCGGLRMVNDLTHGHVGAAFGSNQMLFLLIPVAAYLWGLWAVRAARGLPMRSALLRPMAGHVAVGVLLVYWIVRNLPFAHVLAP